MRCRNLAPADTRAFSEITLYGWGSRPISADFYNAVNVRSETHQPTAPIQVRHAHGVQLQQLAIILAIHCSIYIRTSIRRQTVRWRHDFIMSGVSQPELYPDRGDSLADCPDNQAILEEEFEVGSSTSSSCCERPRTDRSGTGVHLS